MIVETLPSLPPRLYSRREAVPMRRAAAEDQVLQRVRPIRNPRRPAIPESIARRLPPGQFATPRWPILHQGEIPEFDPETWDFRVSGLVGRPTSWTWDAFRALPSVTTNGDLHCVTRWSTLDHIWTGVAPRTIVELAEVGADARFALLHGEGGYTANLPLTVFLEEDVIFATHHAGEPLTPEHGAPLRAVVPSRYAWKSVKWLRGIEFLAEDRQGFWEGYGYSNSADPWREERFES
jgi:DMSO/TMAO reductase YedYZ molybdopterin-dependent catalytic subunit